MRESERDALIIVASCVIIGLSLYSLIGIPDTSFGAVEVHNIHAEGNLISLHTGCHILSMSTSQPQISSINQEFENETTRPMTHDLALDLVESSGSSVETVKIHSFQNGTYYSDIILSNGEKVDARPSDALALSLRTDSPVKVDRNLLHSEGEMVCDHFV